MPEGVAFGAVTVLNATATGRGCSLALVDGMEAIWEWQDEGVIIQGAPDARLAKACVQVAAGTMGRPAGARITTRSHWPPSRGLKTSSQAAAAMLRAAGLPDVEAAAVEASRQAGVTITGAFDDQVAVCRGGCHLTDNVRQQVLARFPVDPWHVAVWVPEHAISKEQVASLDATAIAPAIHDAEAKLLADDIPAALTANGQAYTQLYLAAGLRVDPRPAQVALSAGALGAGLSGTGPAVAALFDARVDLDPVPGGTWQWSMAQELT